MLINNDTSVSYRIEILQFLLLLLFFFPLFVQLSGQIFHETVSPYDPKGNVFDTPLPISIPITFIAIVLCYRFEDRHFGMEFVVAVFMIMLLSISLTSSDNSVSEFSKFILLIQFIIPIFALVLGKIYKPPNSKFLTFEAITLYVLLIILPLQITSTLMWDRSDLSPDLFLFSLYQHTQYLPNIFIGFFFLSIITFNNRGYFKFIFVILAPLVGMLALFSLDLSNTFFLVACSIIFLVTINHNWIFKCLIILLIWLSFLFYYSTIKNNFSENLASEVQELKKLNKQEKPQLSFNSNQMSNFFNERIPVWKFYLNGTISSTKTILFGNRDRPSRNVYTSANNYYLDIAYNFGIIALIPILVLIFRTIFLTMKLVIDRQFPKEFIMISFIIFYFIFLENMIKVSFRQPFSGLIMFFLWGVYLERLEKIQSSIDLK